jgi:hypothetical protein
MKLVDDIDNILTSIQSSPTAVSILRVLAMICQISFWIVLLCLLLTPNQLSGEEERITGISLFITGFLSCLFPAVIGDDPPGPRPRDYDD